LEKGDNSSHLADGQIEDDILQAAMIALTAFFRFVPLAPFVRHGLFGWYVILHSFIIIAEGVVKLERKQ
jgi:hypothetical protein